MEKAKLPMTRPDSPLVGSWAYGVGRVVGLLAQPWKVGTPHAPRYDTRDPQPLCMPQRGAPVSEGKDRADHRNTKSVMLKHLFWGGPHNRESCLAETRFCLRHETNAVAFSILILLPMLCPS